MKRSRPLHNWMVSSAEKADSDHEQNEILKADNDDESDAKVTLENNGDVSSFSSRPSLPSLVIPWSSIILLGIFAAVSQILSDPSLLSPTFNESSSSTTTSSLFFFFSSQQEPQGTTDFLERALSDQSQHHVDQIYNETHQPLFPLTFHDYIGFFCATIGLMIAAGGGIGGGGMLVPIYILIFGFSPKHAIPLSNVTVLGGALANTVLNYPKRHPLADRPLVDWDLILVMEPLTIAGALMGAFLNKLLPEALLVVMLVLLLSLTAHGTLKKAIKMHQIETRHLREQGIKPDGSKESELTLISDKEGGDNVEEAADELLEYAELQDGEVPGDGENAPVKRSPEQEKELQQILEEETQIPMTNIVILVSMFIVVLIINIMKGGGAFSSPLGIKCGSTEFWIANAIMLGWILFISICVRSYLVKRFERKAKLGYKYVEGDIKWDKRATIVYPTICCLAGFFAGMFGIGGGIVKGPLMLAMGVHPAVSSASSACMILFTSFTATTSFIVFGLLTPDYSPVCFAVGFCATLVGQVGLSYLMKKYQRNSFIAFSIGGVVLLSAILMTIQSLLSMAEGEHHKTGGICGHDE